MIDILSSLEKRRLTLYSWCWLNSGKSASDFTMVIYFTAFSLTTQHYPKPTTVYRIFFSQQVNANFPSCPLKQVTSFSAPLGAAFWPFWEFSTFLAFILIGTLFSVSIWKQGGDAAND